MGESILCNCKAVGEKKPTNNCCNVASRAILKTKNVESGDRIIIVNTDVNNSCETTADDVQLNIGVNILNENIDQGLPVIVGVQKLIYYDDKGFKSEKCSGNSPESANHYVVIVSRNNNTYRYYEVGRSNEIDGTSENYIFTLENNFIQSQEIINENVRRKYRITDIRKNNKIK